jgi:glycosyltransferase involved in cell wall biosynthesis
MKNMNENNIRVLIITTSFPRWKDDNRSPFIFEKAKSLVEKGCDVTVVALHTPGSKCYEEIDGVKVNRIRYSPEKFEILQTTRAGIPAAWDKNKFVIFQILLFILKLSFFIIKNKKKYDIVHSNWTISSFSAVISKRFHKKPIITSVHGSDINQAIKNRFFCFLTKIVINSSNKIICVSEDLRKKIINLAKTPSHLLVIPNGVNTNIFYPDSINKEKIILFVGSLTQNKRIDLLINSFGNIFPKIDDYSLYIVGDGPEEESLKELAKNKLPHSSVKFTGSLSREEISNLMRKSFILVLPSINEGFGVVLIEALASGLPCIGANSGGIVDIINEEVGILFSLDNGQELENAILTLVNNELIYEKMSKQARIIAVNKYDWSIISEKIIEAYKDLIPIR